MADLLVAGLEGSGNLLDQVFGHNFGLLEEAGSHEGGGEAERRLRD
jgi:hypothetical protein